MPPRDHPGRSRGVDLFELLGPPTDEQARTLVRLLGLGPYARPTQPTGDKMTKPRLAQEEHRELGAKLSGIRHELLYRGTQLSNAYPRSGPEAEPRRHLDDAIEALDKARTALENLCFAEHPRTAATTDYFPHEEDRAMVVLPRRR